MPYFSLFFFFFFSGREGKGRDSVFFVGILESINHILERERKERPQTDAMRCFFSFKKIININ
jgi:hypothetical protein